MMGLRSPGSATPEVREDWQQAELAADVILRRDQGNTFPAPSSPFTPSTEAAHQPLEETVVVTPDRVFHSLAQPTHRNEDRSDLNQRPDPAVKWKEGRTLLILWLACAIVMFTSSLYWLQIGMWAGALGIMGASLPLCGCWTPKRLPANVHVTRLFAVACSALSIFTALLFTFLLIKLHCPSSVKSSSYCGVFWLGLIMTTIWHACYALVAALVSLKATTVVALLEPIGLRRVVVLRPPGRTRSPQNHGDSPRSHQRADSHSR